MNIYPIPKEVTLIATSSDKIKRISPNQVQEVAKALSGDLRMRILEILGDQVLSITQLMQALGVAQPTVSINVQILEQAGLIETTSGANREKICSRIYDSLFFELPNVPGEAFNDMEDISMPIGLYTDCAINSPCGLVNKDNLIGCPDDPRSFYLPERSDASLLWFSEAGFVEYRFPNPVPMGIELSAIQFSAELCSEAMGFQEDWPSDITLFINGIRIGTITSAGDFGKIKGRLTPAWWLYGTQYGNLYEWRTDQHASFLNGIKVSDATLQDLNLKYNAPIAVRLEVEKTAQNQRGMNLFGSAFGNYEQDLKLSFIRKK
jgi:predicted transcriptional regulator